MGTMPRLGLRSVAALALCCACTAAPPQAVTTPRPSPPPASPSAPPRLLTPLPTLAAAVGPSCTEHVTLPAVPDVAGVAWSPDGNTLVVSRVVALPSDRITGSPEDFFLDALDLRTGELNPLGVGERVRFSASGTRLAYWSWDGELRIVAGGRVIDLPKTTMPDVRWVGETLLLFEKDEIRSWTDGAVRTVAKLPPEIGEPTYPHDDAYFSADGTRFTLTRYAPDGSVIRYLGDIRTGTVSTLEVGGATYLEWSPAGATLLVRYADRLELRAPDGMVRSAPLSRFAGPVHAWAPDGQTPLVGRLSPAVAGTDAFDAFAAWGDGPPTTWTLPDLVGPRSFGPGGRYFAGDSRTGLRTTGLALYRCVAAGGAAPTPRATGANAGDEGKRYVRPVVGAVTQVIRPGHTGIDVAAPFGTVIVADDDGTIDAVGWVEFGGRRVCVQHPLGLESCFYHTSAALVSVGDRVVRGQPIALIGLTGVTTGPHVHWEEKFLGRIIVDPRTK